MNSSKATLDNPEPSSVEFMISEICQFLESEVKKNHNILPTLDSKPFAANSPSSISYESYIKIRLMPMVNHVFFSHISAEELSLVLKFLKIYPKKITPYTAHRLLFACWHLTLFAAGYSVDSISNREDIALWAGIHCSEIHLFHRELFSTLKNLISPEMYDQVELIKSRKGKNKYPIQNFSQHDICASSQTPSSILFPTIDTKFKFRLFSKAELLEKFKQLKKSENEPEESKDEKKEEHTVSIVIHNPTFVRKGT